MTMFIRKRFGKLAVAAIFLSLLLFTISWSLSPLVSQSESQLSPAVHLNQRQPTVENRFLIFICSTDCSVLVALRSLRYKFTSVKLNSKLPILTRDDGVGLFAVIIFEDMQLYLDMSPSNRAIIDSYCKKYGVGIIYFHIPKEELEVFGKPLANLPLNYTYGNAITIKKVKVSSDSVMLLTTRNGTTHELNRVQMQSGWIAFHPRHNTYETVCTGYRSNAHKGFPLVILDHGRYDGIRRVFFGREHGIWLHKLLFLDSIHYLTSGAISLSREKLIQIDIDDMFIGAPGTKMNDSDAMALHEVQQRWANNHIPGFKFVIGFSGSFFKKGLPAEKFGDEKILSLKDNFLWFDHTFNHVQAHKISNYSKLRQQFELSRNFAEAHNISVDPSYTVAPHHSGVYPVYDDLYRAWKDVWHIKVTSTEEYPHLRPSWARRGFIYKDIMVLPRQTCGLFTHNLFYEKYPGGPEVLEQSILGGDLFDSLLYNPINIYMTHQQNYANDRLALYTFEKVIQVFKNSSTLKFKGAPPLELANKYFNQNRDERNIFWTNPCDDRRHLDIWSFGDRCSMLPNLLLVGPQKTGTTALYQYLQLHPNISANEDSEDTFEELQFFGTKNYRKGIHWYMQFFTKNGSINFEKSATYFDQRQAPKQAAYLLPKAKIIITLIDPVNRAFSWYHHVRAHGDKTALNYSFFEIISSTDEQSPELKQLRSRMIRPGFYYEHLSNWLHHYSIDQVLIVDGDKLKSDPISIMRKIQQFLNLKKKVDYTSLIEFDSSKGFFCAKENGRKKCLGAGKGRSRAYGKVGKLERAYLNSIFLTPNMYLYQFMVKHGLDIPDWLNAVQ